MFITDALSLLHVPRWAVVRMSRPQSVAEHSFAVAMITQELMTRNPDIVLRNSPEDDGVIRGVVRHDNVIWHALTHDIDECVTGDIPGIAKQHMRAKREIPDLVPDRPPIGVTLPEIQLVKLADIIETYTYCVMFGHGPHANAVAEKHLFPMLERARLDSQEAGLVSKDQTKFMKLIHDILAERGRLRTFDPYKP